LPWRRMVGAARFELATPGPPDIASCVPSSCSLRRLAGSSVGASGLISGLLVAQNVFQRGSNLIIQNMSIAGRGLDVRGVQRLLWTSLRLPVVAAGVAENNIYGDTASGKDDDRVGLAACLKALRGGDTLVVWKLDRLGRNRRHLVNAILRELEGGA
jgi:resolvase-like protein